MDKEKGKKLREEIWDNFVEQQYVSLATADGDQPRVRPVTLIVLGGKFFVATGFNDAKTSQIQGNPKVEFSLLLDKEGSQGTIRAECVVKLVNDGQVKGKVFKKIPFIKEFFKTPEDPSYALLELEPKLFEYMKPGSIQSVKLKL